MTVESPFVFADEEAWVKKEPADGPLAAKVAILDRGGWGKEQDQTLHFKDGKASVKIPGSGLLRVRVEGEEVRFMVLSPVEKLGKEILKSLPLKGEKLLKGEPFTILAMGDSVTATGEYPAILGRFLARATGNKQIKVEVRAYAGRSVDASVRRWQADMESLHPDLGLIMYGLNDQAANVSLPAFIEQTRWLVEHLRKEKGADVILLEPTPHIDILEIPKAGEVIQESSIFRTIIYAEALHQLGDGMGIPVAGCFRAVWGKGAASLVEEARSLWPLFPPHYSKQFYTMADSEGKGDTIHPNVLGHSEIARAVFQTIAGSGESLSLEISGQSSWEKNRPVSRLKIRNISGKPRKGTLKVFPLPQNDECQSLDYSLASGESSEMLVHWPDAAAPDDLRKPALWRAFKSPGPYLQLLDLHDGQSAVSAVPVPWQPAFSVIPGRQVVEGRKIKLQIQDGSIRKEKVISLPAGNQVGRMAIKESKELAGEVAWALADLSYVKFGSASRMEVEPDGFLSEWSKSSWIPLGEPVQARWSGGQTDNRRRPEDCYLHWSFAAGKDGIFLAFKATGVTDKDSFTVYFDPRSPSELGSAGPYYWLDGKMKPGNKIELRAGDSSGSSEGMKGTWQKETLLTTAELFVPYGVMNKKTWPEGGDLGLSIVWQHLSEDGKVTRLMWAEDGHPWNTRWFGVVRLEAAGELPFRIRVE